MFPEILSGLFFGGGQSFKKDKIDEQFLQICIFFRNFAASFSKCRKQKGEITCVPCGWQTKLPV